MTYDNQWQWDNANPYDKYDEEPCKRTDDYDPQEEEEEYE